MESVKNEIEEMFKKCERKTQNLMPYRHEVFEQRMKEIISSRFSSILACKQLIGIKCLECYIYGRSNIGYYCMQDITNRLKVTPSYLFGISDKNEYSQKKAGYIRLDWIFQFLNKIYPNSTIAYDLGCSSSTVKTYIDGKTCPTHIRMYNLARLYHLDIDSLYGYFSKFN